MRCRRALALRRGVDALWLAAVIALVACVKPIGGLRFDPPDGGDVGDIGGVGGDDMAMNPDAGCVPQSVGCNGNVLQTCRTDGSGYDETTCAAGCGGGSPMRCLVFVPHDPITAADLDPTALAAAGAIFTSGTQYILNTDDGSIVDQNGTKLRLAGSGVISGIRRCRVGHEYPLVR